MLKKVTTITVIDESTGETIQIRSTEPDQIMQSIRGTADRIHRAMSNASKSPASEQFIQVNQQRLKEACKDSGLTMVDYRVYQFCLSDAEYGGVIKSTQVEIAKELELAQATVNRSFGRLQAMKMIEKAGRKMGCQRFRISRDHAIKGMRALKGTKNIDNVIRLDFKAEKLKRSL